MLTTVNLCNRALHYLQEIGSRISVSSSIDFAYQVLPERSDATAKTEPCLIEQICNLQLSPSPSYNPLHARCFLRRGLVLLQMPS